MKNSDEYFLELKDSVSIMDLYTEEPCDAHFHFHEDYEIYLFQGGDVDLYIEQSFHHMLRGHLAVLMTENYTGPVITAGFLTKDLPFILIPVWFMECPRREQTFWDASRTTAPAGIM